MAWASVVVEMIRVWMLVEMKQTGEKGAEYNL